MEILTEAEVIIKLKELQTSGDQELAHVEADNILSAFLISKGYSEIVKEYDEIAKWYA